MTTLAERIIKLLEHNPGLTDREITNSVKGPDKHQAPINNICNTLNKKGILVRSNRSDGKIGNYLASHSNQIQTPHKVEIIQKSTSENLSEDDAKRILEKWLIKNGWQVRVAWGHERGIDIEAHRENMVWMIEVKGNGSRQPMRVNYFLGALGELLQRMNNPNAKYSIAFPDMQQFRGLWDRFPNLAKSRTGISALFVDANENVVQL